MKQDLELPIIGELNGIQSELFSQKDKQIIQAEKNRIEAEMNQLLLKLLKVSDNMSTNIAILEKLDLNNYPKTDLVKLYRRFQDAI